MDDATTMRPNGGPVSRDAAPGASRGAAGTGTPSPLPPARGHEVTPSSRSPLYHQIYLIYRDEILSGTHRPGDLLPSEHELARLYGVSRITAKRALSELADAGLVERRRGRGTTVRHVLEPPLTADPSAGWLHSIERMGDATSVTVLDFDYGPANAMEAARLSIAQDEEVQRTLRVRSHDGEPFSLLATVLPGAIGHTFAREDLERTPMIALLRRAGIAIGTARQAITATLANQATAQHLGTEVGTPLLKLERIVYAKDGVPAEALTALYRPDRYQLEMVLTSDEADDAGF